MPFVPPNWQLALPFDPGDDQSAVTPEPPPPPSEDQAWVMKQADLAERARLIAGSLGNPKNAGFVLDYLLDRDH